jgi:hypothetical protein
MGQKNHWSWRFTATFLALALIAPVSTFSQPLPRSLSIGSNPPGTVFYALASGLAKVASEGAPTQLVVQPYSGTSTFLP